MDIRILHTHIIDDPYDDPAGLVVPDHSPERSVPKEEVVPRGLTKEDLKDKNAGKTAEELEKERKRLEAQSHAVVLEMIGDLPDADVKPPENVLFVCQLNPVTEDEDLRMIFFRFGVKSCEIIRDHETGNSLGYAFIEFETEQGAVDAYYKMNNVLIDDRRIKVDFSQSVSKLWNRRRRGEQMTALQRGDVNQGSLEKAAVMSREKGAFAFPSSSPPFSELLQESFSKWLSESFPSPQRSFKKTLIVAVCWSHSMIRGSEVRHCSEL
mgnify:FL=1